VSAAGVVTTTTTQKAKGYVGGYIQERTNIGITVSPHNGMVILREPHHTYKIIGYLQLAGPRGRGIPNAKVDLYVNKIAWAGMRNLGGGKYTTVITTGGKKPGYFSIALTPSREDTGYNYVWWAVYHGDDFHTGCTSAKITVQVWV